MDRAPQNLSDLEAEGYWFDHTFVTWMCKKSKVRSLICVILIHCSQPVRVDCGIAPSKIFISFFFALSKMFALKTFQWRIPCHSCTPTISIWRVFFPEPMNYTTVTRVMMTPMVAPLVGGLVWSLSYWLVTKVLRVKCCFLHFTDENTKTDRYTEWNVFFINQHLAILPGKVVLQYRLQEEMNGWVNAMWYVRGRKSHISSDGRAKKASHRGYLIQDLRMNRHCLLLQNFPLTCFFALFDSLL